MPSENKAKALEIYLEHQGNITNRKIAELLGEKEKTISAWKSRGKWKEVLQNNECSTTDKSVVLQEKKCSTTKHGAPPGNKNAAGHGAPKGNKNAVGNRGGPPKHNTNAATHHLYSKVIPIDDLDLFEAAGEIDSLAYELQVARYKVNRLIREQQNREMLGVMGGPDGAENFRLKDDFYEQAIQKGLDIVRKIETQVQKQRLDEEKLALERRKVELAEKSVDDKDSDNDDVTIIDDIGDTDE
jgi:hypothetical protein